VHPAFDLSLLSSDYRRQLHDVPVAHVGPTPTTTDTPHLTIQYYPKDYLEAFGPLRWTIDAWYDNIGYLYMLFVSVGTMILALTPFLWIFDPAPLDWGSLFTNFEETFFLIRSVLLAGLAWVHGLASAYAPPDGHSQQQRHAADGSARSGGVPEPPRAFSFNRSDPEAVHYHPRPDPGHTIHCAVPACYGMRVAFVFFLPYMQIVDDDVYVGRQRLYFYIFI